MRLRRSGFRFIAIAAVLATVWSAGPALAQEEPDRWPNPARQPTFHRSQLSGANLGTLRIPAIGVNEVVRSGVSLDVIDQGVAHWAGTARPGEAGNVVLAGHRSTHTRPFWALGELDVGDLIFLTDGYGFEVMYRVSESFIVDPSALWISHETGEPELTMFACHPKGSAAYRIVVSAELVSGRRIA